MCGRYRAELTIRSWELKGYKNCIADSKENAKFDLGVKSVNNFHPNILHAVLFTFPKVLTSRICLTITSFLSWWQFALFSWPFYLIQRWNCKEKLDASHGKGSKGELWYRVSSVGPPWVLFFGLKWGPALVQPKTKLNVLSDNSLWYNDMN